LATGLGPWLDPLQSLIRNGPTARCRASIVPSMGFIRPLGLRPLSVRRFVHLAVTTSRPSLDLPLPCLACGLAWLGDHAGVKARWLHFRGPPWSWTICPETACSLVIHLRAFPGVCARTFVDLAGTGAGWKLTSSPVQDLTIPAPSWTSCLLSRIEQHPEH